MTAVPCTDASTRGCVETCLRESSWGAIEQVYVQLRVWRGLALRSSHTSMPASHHTACQFGSQCMIPSAVTSKLEARRILFVPSVVLLLADTCTQVTHTSCVAVYVGRTHATGTEGCCLWRLFHVQHSVLRVWCWQSGVCEGSSVAAVRAGPRQQMVRNTGQCCAACGGPLLLPRAMRDDMAWSVSVGLAEWPSYICVRGLGRPLL